MFKNKKGAALLQVLLVTVILAGLATMLLRASLSRSTAARQTRRTVSAQLLVNSCMAEVNTLWSIKSPEAFARDMNQCLMYCKSTDTTATCSIPVNGRNYTVTAEFTESAPTADGARKCELSYTVDDSQGVL